MNPVDYTVYDNITGKIVRCGVTMPNLWRRQLDVSAEEGSPEIDEMTGRVVAYDLSPFSRDGLTIVAMSSNIETDYFDIEQGKVLPIPA